jgi:hypothetical protein
MAHDLCLCLTNAEEFRHTFASKGFQTYEHNVPNFQRQYFKKCQFIIIIIIITTTTTTTTLL